MMQIDQHIAGVEAIIGYAYQDKSFCAEALQMQTSFDAPLTFGGQDRRIAHNSRLELLGDRMIEVVLCKKWYRTGGTTGPKSPLVHYSHISQALVSNKALGARGYDLGLDRFVLSDPGTTTVSTKMVAKTFEAIVGAVSLDAGDEALEAVYKVLEHTGFFEHPMLAP